MQVSDLCQFDFSPWLTRSYKPFAVQVERSSTTIGSSQNLSPLGVRTIRIIAARELRDGMESRPARVNHDNQVRHDRAVMISLATLLAASILGQAGPDLSVKTVVRGGDPSSGMLVNYTVGARPFDPINPSLRTVAVPHGLNPSTSTTSTPSAGTPARWGAERIRHAVGDSHQSSDRKTLETCSWLCRVINATAPSRPFLRR